MPLGKYSPIHRGHQYLIVIAYAAPGTMDISTATRAGWIRSLYPQAEVLEAEDGPEATGCANRLVDRGRAGN